MARLLAEPLWMRREAVLAAALVLIVAGMAALTGGRFVEPGNLRDIALNTAIPAVAAAGMLASAIVRTQRCIE